MGEPTVSLRKIPEDEGYWVIKSPGVVGQLPIGSESCIQHIGKPETQKKVKHARYRERIAKSERTRERLLAVLADHSTEGSI